ncbi:MAG: serine protein kinase RIO [Myxococcales bacterium]|nr:serine protein kinase RIO [Myxococcales bacterium]
MKIPDRLLPLLEMGLVQEVVRPLMAGKEAAVYIVWADDRYCVAKVYKEAIHRSFRQKASYTEGRVVRNSRNQRAMDKGSKYGREQAEAAWQTAEVDNLYKLGAAGVRVPKPFVFSEGVLLMELVLDPHDQPAPRLCDCSFTPEQAFNTHAFVMRQVVLMLCAGMVHGDLSEYNVLLSRDGPVIIDLPQAVDAAQNRNAKSILLRDVNAISAFLGRHCPGLSESQFGPEIWSLYERAQLFPDSHLTGRFRGSTRQADVRGVRREIDAAAREAKLRRR